MDIPSLAFRTDLSLARLAGSEVEDRGDHVVVRTPDNPDYYWGNYLFLPRPPTPDEVADWEEVFTRTFPRCRHRAYGVAVADGARDDLAAFAAAGLETEAATVMTATAVHEPPRPNHEATYRPLTGDEDWEQQVGLWSAGEDVAATPDFVRAKVAGERRMTESGQGAWWGAFLGDRLLSSMGLVAADPGLARFQQVQTHPDARGRGLAGTLVHRVARYGFEELGARTLVMVADPEYLAIRIYRSVGFEGTETQLQAQRRPS
ncbi:GNAT family N-acetyltransferase [Nocardioides sp.]|uniref:GNAT family N-acetyltransferase n=1 Tax=Nocardioides sp. TaxID=35761 RepID=UPI0037839736